MINYGATNCYDFRWTRGIEFYRLSSGIECCRCLPVGFLAHFAAAFATCFQPHNFPSILCKITWTWGWKFGAFCGEQLLHYKRYRSWSDFEQVESNETFGNLNFFLFHWSLVQLLSIFPSNISCTVNIVSFSKRVMRNFLSLVTACLLILEGRKTVGIL